MKRFALSLLAFGLLAASTAEAQTTHAVSVTNVQFNPAALTIDVGDTVTWTNTQGFHNVNATTADYPSNPEGFGNALANAPWTFSHTFTLPGTYGYHCDAHGAPGVGMFGTITVNAASPDVTANVEPVNGPIVLPPAGGRVRFTNTLTNTTAVSQTVEFWNVLTLPNGMERTLRRQTRTLAPGQTFTANGNASIQANSPSGTYTVTLNVGTFAAPVEDSDSFTFTKSASSGLSAGEAAAHEHAHHAPPEAALATGSGEAVAAYPNPAEDGAVIRFTLDAANDVRLAVYDARGREVALLVDGPVEAGRHEAAFDGSAFPAGVYVYRLVVGGAEQAGRLTLVK